MSGKPDTSLLAALLLSMGLGLAGCGAPPADGGDIVIGVIEPFLDNPQNVRGATLAAEEINRAGGLMVGGRRREIRLLAEDSEESPERALGKALHLITRERVVALVGLPQSHSAIPVARVAEERRIPMISTLSTQPETTAGKEYVFRLAFLDVVQGQVMAAFALHDLGATEAAVLFDASSTYSSGLAEVFSTELRAAGGRVSAFESFTNDALDVGPQLARIRESGAEVLFLPSYTALIPGHVAQALELGFEGTFLGADTWGLIPAGALAPQAAAYFSDVWAPDSPGTRAAAFISGYRRAFGETPGSSAALAYDAIVMIVEAIRSQHKADAESIRRGLASIGRFEGASGSIRFAGSGDPLRSVFIRRVDENGKTSFHREIQPHGSSGHTARR